MWDPDQIHESETKDKIFIANVSWAQQFKVEKEDAKDQKWEQSEGNLQRPGTFESSQDKIARTFK